MAGNEFSLVFDDKNVDDLNTIEDVQIKIYDWGACTPLVDESLPSE